MKGFPTSFIKYHGNGNDFIVFDLVHHTDADVYQSIIKKVKTLCDRHRGIGSDGVLIVQKLAGQWCMTLINADGTHAKNCGNGLRVAALHLAKVHHVQDPVIKLGGQNFACHVVDDNEVMVHMGICKVTTPSDFVFDEFNYRAPCMRGTIGNRHVVFLIDGVHVNNYERLIAPIQRGFVDAQELNIGFLWLDAVGNWHSQVFERGVGFTKSCGTGAMVAASFVRLLSDDFANPVVIHQPGGNLKVTTGRCLTTTHTTSLEIIQQGSAEEIFKGICQL